MKYKIVQREVLNPVADTNILRIGLNPIKGDINRICLIDNTKPNTEVILEVIKKNLSEFNFFKLKKPAGAPATLQQIKKASQHDLSILALADCGSCTAWVILDAIRLEKLGIPTISLCSHQFYSFARELSGWHGMGNLRIVEIPHPISGQSKKKVTQKTLKILPQIKNIIKSDIS